MTRPTRSARLEEVNVGVGALCMCVGGQLLSTALSLPRNDSDTAFTFFDHFSNHILGTLLIKNSFGQTLGG
jgi:hypothetical protein